METQPKKLMILQILEILKRHSDADHPLSQKEIQELLKTEYGMEAERKAVRFSEESDTHVTVSVRANRKAIMQFAISYTPDVMVLEPKEVRNEVKSTLERAVEEYNREEKTKNE